MTTALLTEPTLYPTRWRQDYVARLTGSDRRYRVAREFCDKGKQDGSYGAFVVAAGVYETRIEGKKSWELFDGRKWHGLPDFTELAKRLTSEEIDLAIGTLEGRSADWDLGCLLCDLEVEHYSADGWPACETHRDDVGQPDWAVETSIDLSMEAPF